MMSNRVVVERWIRAVEGRDLETLAELTHPDIVVSYPQSGEQITGRDGVLAMARAFPTWPEVEFSVEDGPRDSVTVLMPGPLSMPSITISGIGDSFVIEGTATYADAGAFHTVTLVTLKDGMVFREKSYFAQPFEPAAWRTPFVDG